ncbi:pantothenate kinase [Aerococcus urinaehominis]|uniref:Pantothenate kinase n=1 Tax=Aerococcus urinaehominis TaxID=128944 RepID=A0A0X8FM16_9LACT|nr:type I pantothenate kinase [Aerococcus urinaehominis]AMB99780.1 pantothenate kinase [Aerococcus urinaehominis]SDM09260.1 pantothenate kinase [Aerococcus urinaehominis]
MLDTSAYHIIDRQQWAAYRDQNQPGPTLSLTEAQLQRLVSLNDEISLQDAKEVYQPLTQLVSLYVHNYWQFSDRRNQFLGIQDQVPPFIIGISGSVAVGKSTAARLLRLFLAQAFPDIQVDLVTTDGFLYPNRILRQHNLMSRKGFPESYDMDRLIQFLSDVKNNVQNISYPMYSHEIYDIVPGRSRVLENPQILIVEGINVFQVPANKNILMTEFYHLSIYVDADTDLIAKWYLERFNILRDQANSPDEYYYRFAKMSYAEAQAYAKNIWETINLVNLDKYILPTRDRADIIIHKTDNHYIDELWMKKY